MSGIFKPPSDDDGYMNVPLLEDERVVCRQAASYLVRRKPMWGGQLVLTSQRLLFRPVDLSGARQMIQDGIDFLPGDLAVFGKVVGKALDYSAAYGEGKAGAVDTELISRVRRGTDASLLRPPTLVLTFRSGRELEIGILAHVRSPNLWPGNNTARDKVVEAVAAELAAS